MHVLAVTFSLMTPVSVSKLTDIASLEQLLEGLLGRSHAALDDGLLPLELALGQPLGELGQCSGVFLQVVKDDEALHPGEGQ